MLIRVTDEDGYCHLINPQHIVEVYELRGGYGLRSALRLNNSAQTMRLRETVEQIAVQVANLLASPEADRAADRGAGAGEE